MDAGEVKELDAEMDVASMADKPCIKQVMG